MKFCFQILVTLATGLLAAPAEALEEPIPEPENRCAYSRVFLAARGDAFVAAPAALSTDDKPAAVHTLAADGSQALEFHFIGAPRWLNRIAVTTDAADLEVEVQDLDRVWRHYVHGPPSVDGQRVSLTGPDVYVRAVRFAPAPVPVGAAPQTVRLSQIEALFLTKDPDGVRLGPAGEGDFFHADWVNSYPGGGNDLSKCDNDAESLASDLPGTWSTYLHGNSNSWEQHFKRVDLGGTNPDHADLADLAYFSGHGTTCTDSFYGARKRVLYFGDQTHDGQCLVPSDARHSWGNGELEWVGISNCQTLKDSDEWYHAMQGLHLVLGWRTNMKDVDFGNYFGGYMVDKGAHDSAKKIKSSWWDAAEETHGWDYKAKIVGETSDMGNDYLWGEGTVAADPTHNGSYHWWTYETCGVGCIFAETPPIGAVSLEAAGPAPAPVDPVEFPKLSKRGFPVVIDRALLAAAPQITMPVYNVVPAVVDTPYVRNVASHICVTEGGVLCGGDIGIGDPGFVNLIDGAYELRVCQNTGGIHYEDTGNWLAWRTTPPTLLSGTVALNRAEQILNAWNRRPPDAFVAREDTIIQGARNGPETGLAADIPESTFAIALRVNYERRLGGSQGFPVVGPGGNMTVTLGHGGALQRVMQGAWRTLTPGPTVNIVPVQDAVQLLTTVGSDATVDGINPIVEHLTIDSIELGYYEYDCLTPQTSVRPVYLFNCTITETPSGVTPPITSQDQLRVWAEALPPTGTILQPQDGFCVPPGSQVCLQGTGMGGIAPLTLTWRDDQQGLLGSGPLICANFNAPPPGHNEQDSTHTVELTVRDALGREGHAWVRICLSTTVDVPPPAGDVRLAFRAVLPNPAVGAVRFAYEVPRAGLYRLEVFDVAGRRVTRFLEQAGEPGPHMIEWDGRDEAGYSAPSGVYFAKLSGNGESVRTQFVMSR